MSSIELKQMADFYQETRDRFSTMNADLATIRDVGLISKQIRKEDL